MADVERKNFSEVFEGGNPVGTPEVQLRRFTQEDAERWPHIRNISSNIGIFWGGNLLAFLDFDDLFDQDGNRFYND